MLDARCWKPDRCWTLSESTKRISLALIYEAASPLQINAMELRVARALHYGD